MTDRPASRSSPRRLAARLRLARAALLWERVWPAAWPALCVLGGFAVLSLFDLLPWLPGAGHVGVLAGFGIAFVGAVAWGVRRRTGAALWNDPIAARRRIELASGLAHRPLQALADRPSAPLDRDAAGLWAAHRRRMEEAARRLRVGWPAAGVARAFVPNFAGGAAAVAASFDLWLTPPEYTGLAPQFLRAGDTETVQVPTGSALLAQVHGGGAVPRLAIDGEG